MAFFNLCLTQIRLTPCDVAAHGCVFIRMLAMPPVQIVQVTAELFWSAFNHGDLQTISERPAAFAARSAPYLLWFNDAVPWDAPIAILIQAGRIDRADCRPCARMPVLAVCPVISGERNTAQFTKRHLDFVRRRISPDTPVAAVESACSTIVRAAVGHGRIVASEDETSTLMTLIELMNTDQIRQSKIG